MQSLKHLNAALLLPFPDFFFLVQQTRLVFAHSTAVLTSPPLKNKREQDESRYRQTSCRGREDEGL